MLRMSPFRLLQPKDLAQAVALAAEHGGSARLLAGGTDLLPALKTGKVETGVVIALGGVAELRGVTLEADGALRIGALTTLDALQRDAAVRARAPALAEAAGHAASPPIRRRATLGGNLLLDVRCRYVDQSALFRHALGGCLKSHGVECHVVPGGRTCVAALSADTVAPLVAHGAIVELLGGEGGRVVPLAELYDADGRTPHRLRQGELVVAVRLPALGAGARVGARRWALRGAIDFPLVSVAARLTLADGALAEGEIVVTAIGPQPRRTSLRPYAGRALDAATRAEVVDLACRRSKAMPNLPFDEGYRQRRLGVELERLLRALAEGG